MGIYRRRLYDNNAVPLHARVGKYEKSANNTNRRDVGVRPKGTLKKNIIDRGISAESVRSRRAFGVFFILRPDYDPDGIPCVGRRRKVRFRFRPNSKINVMFKEGGVYVLRPSRHSAQCQNFQNFTTRPTSAIFFSLSLIFSASSNDIRVDVSFFF